MASRRGRQKGKAHRRSIFSYICPCVASRSAEDEQRYVLADEKDRYEYVVEKLAIKKVPLSVFGTELDYETVNAGCAPEAPESPPPLAGKDKNYQSYFLQMRQRNRSSPPRIETTSSASSSENSAHSPCPIHRQQRKPKSPAKLKNNEAVTHILNKYSSLYTLDDKETVPKDPLTFPAAAAGNNSRGHSPTCPTMMMPKKEIPRVPFEQYKLHVQRAERVEKYAPDPLKTTGMTKSMRKTINALGSAKPYTKIMLSRNHRASTPPVRDDPVQNLKRFQSEELTCVALDERNPKIKHRYEYERSQKTPTKYEQIFSRENSYTKDASPYSSTTKSSNTNQLVLMSSTSCQSLPRVIEEENKLTILPSKFSVKETRLHPESASEQSYTTFNKDSNDPIMEINHMKGKNLKWKIIIKHHDDVEK